MTNLTSALMPTHSKEIQSNAILNPRPKENMMLNVEYLTMTELEAGLEHIRQAPKDHGTLKMIVRRPREDERELMDQGDLSLTEGLVGDTWKSRGSRHTSDGSATLYSQITVMNARCAALLAQSEERWAMAGDQLFVDFDLSEDNIPPGTRLAVGSVILEVSAEPHSGCKKFSARFGVEALKFVNSPEGKRLHLRGINARVIQAGTIRVGDIVSKV
jgi:MOSC domain-containing protein YiiM